KRAALSLPPHARVLQKVTVEYKNLDGSIESKTINVNNAVDWHLPIFISQSYVDTVSVLPKEQQEDSYSLLGEIAFAKFYEKKKSFKILTSDKLIRNFLLADPHRIVIDFQKDATLKSFIKKNPKSIFKTVRVGNHKGYYRVVLELDGAYRYQMNIENDGYSFKLF
ncbi:MAG: AMIN domain-containing protein, partial [Sulfurimonadaceae bacterium]